MTVVKKVVFLEEWLKNILPQQIFMIFQKFELDCEMVIV